jgi:hypothetical protein
MIPGADQAYQCPHCGNFLWRRTLTSGNTAGATTFSDGKMVAPMLPKFPDLTKCKKCNSIIWLSDLAEIQNWGSWSSYILGCIFGQYVAFLGIEDLFSALAITNDKEKEKFIRIKIWWAFNDRVRKRRKIFIKENDEKLWEQNCLALINLLDKNDANQKIMIAELYRNLGQFDSCMELINSLPKDIDWLKDKFQRECTNKNQKLFVLS